MTPEMSERTPAPRVQGTNTGMTTLGELAEEIGSISQDNRDRLVPVKKLHFPEGIERVVIGTMSSP